MALSGVPIWHFWAIAWCADGSLPLLFPMSEVAGRLAPLVGANCLMRPEGGRGVLIGGVSGVEPARSKRTW